MNSFNMLNKDVNQIIFDCLPIPEKYNFYLYCKENNLEELQYVEKYFQSLYNISYDKWVSIIIDNQHRLPYEIIRKYKDVIDWHLLSVYQTFTPEFINEFADYIEWNTVSSHQPLTINTLREYTELINWVQFSARDDLTEEMIDIFSNKIDWFHIKLNDVSDDLLNKYSDKIHWSNVSFTNKERYEVYEANVDWVRLSYHETLDEDFMRRNQDRLNWNFLSSHQVMSDEFVEEFGDKINMETRNFFNNRNSSPSFQIQGVPMIPPPLLKQSKIRRFRPSFFEY